MRLLGPTFLSAFPGRVLNVHPALLPAFPGHDVWPQQIAHGVKLAGATVHFVDAGVDTGPIVIQGAVPALDADGPDELAERILQVEHRILPQAVAWAAQGRLELEGRRVKLKAPPAVGQLEALIWPPLD
jgi:phosphoribosylglycinamide formyltransferase-1